MSGGLEKKHLLLSIFFLCWVSSSLSAQNGSNPFELKHRLPESTKVDSSTSKSSNPFDLQSRQKADTPAIENDPEPAIEPASKNPFDIQRARTGGQNKKQISPVPIIQKKQKANPAEPNNKRGGFMFWSMLTLLILLALLLTLYRSLIVKIYRAFSNENVLKLLQREQGGIISAPYMFLYALFFMSAGSFVFHLGWYKRAVPYNFQTLAYCVLGIAGFFILKHILLKLLEIIFPIAKEIKQYSFTIIIFSIMLGIILIPFNVFIAFVQDSFIFGGIVAGLIVTTLIYLFRGLRGLFISSKFLAFHKFHFFMYLCTVEIAPLLVIIKLLLVNGASIH